MWGTVQLNDAAFPEFGKNLFLPTCGCCDSVRLLSITNDFHRDSVQVLAGPHVDPAETL